MVARFRAHFHFRYAGLTAGRSSRLLWTKMRVRHVTLAIALGAVGCAAVAGLGDLEIVACSDGCDASAAGDGSTVVPLSDGGSVVISGDSGDDDDSTVTDAGAQDSASPPDLDGAIPIVPDCTIGACPSPLGSVCANEPCSNNGFVWQQNVDAGPTMNVSADGCRASVPNSAQQFLSHTLAVADKTRFEVAFHVVAVKLNDPQLGNTATVVELRFGNTLAVSVLEEHNDFRLCNAGGTCQTVPIPSSSDTVRLELYVTAGSEVSAGQAALSVSDANRTGPGACEQALTIPLPGPLAGDPSVDVGCIESTQSCQLTFTNATLSATSF